MSRTFNLACAQCKKSIWIGQAGSGEERGHIYTGDQAVMAALNEFLWDHVGHSLVFCDDTTLSDHEEIFPAKQNCPYSPGDVIWYVYAMPGSDYIARLVLSVDGSKYRAYDPFLNEDIDNEWRPNTGHSIGDSGLHRESTVYPNDKARIIARAEADGLRLRFASE
jgi:hypothetical protein